DYEGEDSDLYGCSDDASLLADVLIQRGLVAADNVILLRDGEVTTTALLEAIHSRIGQTSEDDVTLIFYSGHGDQREDDGSDELDGLDETIAVFDGHISDDQLVAETDQLDGTVILALDSCHSGGFSRDFVNRPNRIGLFSSDEDTLSDTAEPLFAGGYLSYFLRAGLSGEADSQPRDGLLLVGELTDYVYSQYVVHDRDFNALRHGGPVQRLVFDRGSKNWTDWLWFYPRNLDGSLNESEVNLQSAPPEPGSGTSAGTCR
ncbi:MAG: caspase family protein, partial [Myxococcales bacterium]|nr:caspase family protein [Myxococcales bacterium]